MHEIRYKIGDEDLILETGKMAKQANGAVVAKYGGSVVLATVCCSDAPVEGLDYVPLQVEYNEKFYAAGKIPGGFLKREGRPKDKEILVCRLIDRPMRPLFNKKFARDIQVVPTVISADQINPPDMLAMVASSAAVVLSDIPFDGPIAGVRICSVNGEMVVNPTFSQIEESELDIIVAGTESGITMVEGGAKEVPEEQMLKAIGEAEKHIAELCKIQNKLRELAGVEKIVIEDTEEEFSLQDKIKEFAYAKLETANFVSGKENRRKAIKAVREETIAAFEEELEEDSIPKVKALFEDMEYEIVRKSILEKGVRTDGRGLADIRPISCEIDVLPRTHGSALFTRGETQALAVTTLGTVVDEKIIDDIDSDKRYDPFMLHYNFPPFSVGETGRLGTGRREIGHGHLAQRAIEAVLPDRENFPYTIRIVSEVLESNGSSSMATVCGSSLSLHNAGVPISQPVAGIAMGLISSGDNAVILSDILGEEDHLGDMDFKVAGTSKGITAFQMDIKISGVSKELMEKALTQAKEGRMHILGIMNETISAPQSEISEFAPQIISFQVDTDKIGAIIGSGGKNIKNISEQFDVNVNIEDDGTVTISGKNRDKTTAAEEHIQAMIQEPEVGTVYHDCEVKRIMDFGAFVEILPGQEGLVHISKLSRERVNSVTDVLKEGQKIDVKLLEIDKMGRLNLSYIDAVDPDGARQRGGGGRSDDRNNSDRRRG